MREEDPAGAMPADALDALLLDAKLSAPQPRTGSVSRIDLIGAARAGGHKVVGVTAPAGYGKSTLLAQWAIAEDRPVGWVSLDRLDDDPAALITLLASAYAQASPGNAELVADMSGIGLSVLGRAAPRLASALRTSPSPFVLMVDDLHELRSPSCHDVLSVVISGVPAGSQLVTASRTEQPHLSRLRAEGEALELNASDLALDSAGAEQIFSEAHVGLTPEQAVAVTERTEGWPAGLYLAALIARDSGNDASAVSGDDRYVADYLYREALTRQPESVQGFLRRTAVLEQLSGPLCDSVLDESRSQDQLRALEASNSFLIPLDRRRQWYRYHALFREFLLGELRRVDPEAVAEMHLRAADWYEANGSKALAIEHLLHTTERERCAKLVAELLLPTYQVGDLSRVEGWLSALGDAAVEEYPPLAVLAGWIAVLTAHTADAQRWAALIDVASFDGVPADGSASFESGRAMLRSVMCPAGPEQCLIDAQLAVAQEAPWSPWRDQALYLCGEAHLLAGDRDRAWALFEEGAAIAAVNSNIDVLVTMNSHLGLLAMDRGRWAEATEFIEIALGAIERNRMFDYATSVIAFASAARLAIHRGDREEATHELTRAMRARPTCTFVLPYFAVRTRLLLAKAHWAIGDQATARHLMREIDDILLQRPRLGTLVDEVSELRELLESSSQAAGGGPPLTAAELRLLPYLQTHLTIREIAARLFVSRNTVNSQIGSIYRKLGVSSRSDAVQQATTTGLLGG